MHQPSPLAIHVEQNASAHAFVVRTPQVDGPARLVKDAVRLSKQGNFPLRHRATIRAAEHPSPAWYQKLKTQPRAGRRRYPERHDTRARTTRDPTSAGLWWQVSVRPPV
jgi:hypothetical protein